MDGKKSVSAPKPRKATKAEAMDTAGNCFIHSRDRLLKAAFEVFSRSGYHGATTKLISQVAGVNEALISRHFATKQGLFFAVIDKNIKSEPAEIPYPLQETLADELIHFADYEHDRLCKQRDFIRIVIGHSMIDQEFGKSLSEHIGQPRSLLLLERLHELQRTGHIKDEVDVESISQTVLLLVISTVLFSQLCPILQETSAHSNLRQTLKILASGLEKPKP